MKHERVLHPSAGFFGVANFNSFPSSIMALALLLLGSFLSLLVQGTIETVMVPAIESFEGVGPGSDCRDQFAEKILSFFAPDRLCLQIGSEALPEFGGETYQAVYFDCMVNAQVLFFKDKRCSMSVGTSLSFDVGVCTDRSRGFIRYCCQGVSIGSNPIADCPRVGPGPK